MTPQSRGKTAKTAVFRHRWQAWQVVRSIAAVRQRPRTPRNWQCSFTFFESFLRHFNEKQRGEVIFRHSRPVSCKNQENGAGKQWSVHAPLKISLFFSKIWPSRDKRRRKVWEQIIEMADLMYFVRRIFEEAEQLWWVVYTNLATEFFWWFLGVGLYPFEIEL